MDHILHTMTNPTLNQLEAAATENTVANAQSKEKVRLKDNKV